MAQVIKRGTTYFLDYHDGTRRIIRKHGPDKAAAIRTLNALLVEAGERKFLGEAAPNRAERVTFGTFVPQYLEHRRTKRPGTQRADRLRTRILTPHLGRLYLDQITPRHVSAMTGGMVGHRSANTINGILTCLSAMLSLAVAWGLLRSRPRIEFLPAPPGRIRYLLDWERDRLWPELRDRRTRLICTIALYTGMRSGEITTLRWCDLDLENAIVHVETTKTHKRRDIPLAREVLDMLQEWPRTGERLFGDTCDFDRQWKNALKRSGIRGFRFHDLRHTFCSYLVMEGRHLREVQQLAGHSSIVQTMKYSHLAPENLRAAIDALSRRLKTEPHGEAVCEEVERILKQSTTWRACSAVVEPISEV
jgi:integrase